jgi:acyl dehydratase
MEFSKIKIGQIFSFDHAISKEDIRCFARISGDNNRLHLDTEFAEKSRFKNNIVHGMLAGSLFSRLIGMYCPGEDGIYLSQSLNFKEPIFPDDELTVRGEIIEKSESTRIITLNTKIIKDKKVAIEGIAKAILFKI